MTRIVLVRHGEVPGIQPPTFRGRMELQLTDHGRTQVLATAQAVASRWHPVAVYTSPMQRCVDTGRAIAEACGTSLAKLEAINDLDYGQWQGLRHDDVEQRMPEQYRRWRETPQFVRFPGGESLQDLALRVADGLREVAGRHPDATVVLVGHDTSIRALAIHVLDLPLAAWWRLTFDPCGISELQLGDGVRTVLRLNETWHLATATRP